ncbi:MAG: 4'-phosphopantetheinyl transferase superfamily protein [Nitrospirota bacterium]|nr:MAG: 4'-phosphopantetheinyl transferase superfamily protein [Nitrospirota bacterium]
MDTKIAALRLSENQVDIWCARLPAVWDDGLFHSYCEILTSEESERYTRFAFENDRRQFLLTRALERDVLSRYLGVEPAALEFTRNEFGKPALAEPSGCPITYSLSHTKGLSVCAVAFEQMIGVDVESLQRTPSHRDISKRFFAAPEAAYLETIDEGQKRAEFIRLWTLKEAFVKARGLGLSIPLNSFEIKMYPDRPPWVFFSDEVHGHEADWRFLQIRFGHSFHIAIALNKPKSKELAVRFSTITPLTEERASLILESNGLNTWVVEEV